MTASQMLAAAATKFGIEGDLRDEFILKFWCCTRADDCPTKQFSTMDMDVSDELLEALGDNVHKVSSADHTGVGFEISESDFE